MTKPDADIFEEWPRQSVKVRARYAAVPGENMIEITQIPPTTTVEAIMDKIAELVKAGKIKKSAICGTRPI